ncbi:MAG: hypothetical protein ABH842_05525 [Candidatus Micrarchaeota archaeon]
MFETGYVEMLSKNSNDNRVSIIARGSISKGFDRIKFILIQISQNWTNFRWLYFNFQTFFLSKVYKLLNRNKNNGIKIVDQEWDNLIILDACRYDSFSNALNEIELKGKLEKVVSQGSSTLEFLTKNFRERHNEDIVYVTTNPYVHTITRDSFHKTINLWTDSWDQKLGVVHPSKVTEKGIETKNKYKNKRLIVHYMQPHAPYIALGKSRLYRML